MSFEQHSLNAITLAINMLQHKVREDIPIVQFHLKRDAQIYFFLDVEKYYMSVY